MIDDDFAVFGNLYLRAGQSLADGSDLVFLYARHMRNAGCLGHAVAFADGNADALEKLDNLVRNRRRAGRAHTYPVEAKAFFQFTENNEVKKMISQRQIQRSFISFNDFVVIFRPDFYSNIVKCTFEPSGVSHFQNNSGIVFFPNPRHGMKQRGRHIPHISHNGVRVFRKVHRMPRSQMKHYIVYLLIDMVKRQKRNGLVIRKCLDHLFGGFGHPQITFMRQQCTFGHTGRTGSIDDAGNVVRFCLHGQLHKKIRFFLVDFLPHFQKLFKTHEHGIFKMFQPLHLPTDKFF